MSREACTKLQDRKNTPNINTIFLYSTVHRKVLKMCAERSAYLLNTYMRKIDAEIQRLEKIFDDCEDRTSSYNNCNTMQHLVVLKDKNREVRFYRNPVLATLTFKFEPREEYVSDRFYKFIDDLSKSVFKMSFRRYSKRVACSAAYEKDDQIRMNIHAVFNRPEFLSDKDFRDRVMKYWKYGYVKFQDTASYYTNDPTDYLNYCFKEETKDLRNKSYADYFLM